MEEDGATGGAHLTPQGSTGLLLGPQNLHEVPAHTRRKHPWKVEVSELPEHRSARPTCSGSIPESSPEPALSKLPDLGQVASHLSLHSLHT